MTASRLKWIDSLRDEVSAFIAVTVRILNPESIPNEGQNMTALLRERDTLMHQIILHLNPHDSEDQALQEFVSQVVALTSGAAYTPELQRLLEDLRNATQTYERKNGRGSTSSLNQVSSADLRQSDLLLSFPRLAAGRSGVAEGAALGSLTTPARWRSG